MVPDLGVNQFEMKIKVSNDLSIERDICHPSAKRASPDSNFFLRLFVNQPLSRASTLVNSHLPSLMHRKVRSRYLRIDVDLSASIQK